VHPCPGECSLRGGKGGIRTLGTGVRDTIVVYEVDRLTRSLADFAKIVEALDAREVSFVSVTQQFNTTTSMGLASRLPAYSGATCEV